jgi:hypothetical protein
MAAGKQEFYFLTPDEVKFFNAFCSLIVPSGADPSTDPGANEVGSIHYVDSTLFDFPKEVQKYFREIVELVNQRSISRFQKQFSVLPPFDQSWILRELFLDPNVRERIFDLRSIALEGFYSDYHDPGYKGVTPWELVQFGGKRITGMKKDWSFLRIWRDSETEKME